MSNPSILHGSEKEWNVPKVTQQEVELCVESRPSDSQARFPPVLGTRKHCDTILCLTS